jgi:hypothetical protein
MQRFTIVPRETAVNPFMDAPQKLHVFDGFSRNNSKTLLACVVLESK